MKNLAVCLALTAGLAGCAALGSKASSANLVTDLALGSACVAEVQQSAPACIAEVPSCVSLGKAVASPAKK